MAISFGGLASGLDTNAIITQLVALERRPIQILEGRQAEQRATLDLFGTFEGLVKDLQKRAQELSKSSGFYAFDLQVGTEGIANISVTGEPQNTSHTLSVLSLASADRYTFDGVVDPDATGLGGGTISFDYWDDDAGALASYSVAVTAGTDSLNDVAAAINSQAGEAVSASVINTGTEVNPNYELVLTGNDTGADYAVQGLTVAGVNLTGQTQIGTASNARAEVDGLIVERSSNLFSDVIEGLSFTVTQADLGGTAQTTFTVESDIEGVQENLRSFVDAYNAVIDFVNKQEEYSEDGGPGGLLFGDPALRSVRSTIYGSLFGVSPTELATLQTNNDGFVTVGQMGLEVDVDGRISFDETTLSDKLSEDLDKFAELFLFDDGDPDVVSDADGAFVKLDDAIQQLIGDRLAVDGNGDPILVGGKELQIEGLFNRRRDTIQTVIDGMDDDIDRLEYGVEKFEEGLILQYARLEELLGRLNSQAAYLNSGAAFPT